MLETTHALQLFGFDLDTEAVKALGASTHHFGRDVHSIQELASMPE